MTALLFAAIFGTRRKTGVTSTKNKKGKEWWVSNDVNQMKRNTMERDKDGVC